MHATALRILRTAQRPHLRCACRTIAGIRHPLPLRTFHSSSPLRQPSKDPGVDDQENKDVTGISASAEQSSAKDGTPSEKELDLSHDIEPTLSQKLRQQNLSDRTKTNRHKQPEGVPPVNLPDWFWEKNVKCFGDPVDLSGSLAVYGSLTAKPTLVPSEVKDSENEEFGEAIGDVPGNSVSKPQATEDPSVASSESTTLQQDSRALQQCAAIIECSLKPTKDAKYAIHVDVYKEILVAMRAGLSLRPPRNIDNKKIRRPILQLQCPKEGGTYYLDSVVETIATKLEADLVRLDAQDIAQIVATYAKENLAWTDSTTASMAYDAASSAGKLEEYSREQVNDRDDYDDLEEDDHKPTATPSGLPSSYNTKWNETSRKVASLLGAAISKKGSKPFSIPILNIKSISSSSQPKTMTMSDFINQRSEPSGTSTTNQGPDQWTNLKYQTALDALVGSADAKRSNNRSDPDDVESSRDLIIQVRDFREINESQEGAQLIAKLRDIVNKRWQFGRNIILVGTTSSDQGQSYLSRPEIQRLQDGDVIMGDNRVIFVPTDRTEQQDIAFSLDEKARIRNLNIRHVQDMISKLLGEQNESLVVDLEKGLDVATAYSSGLEDAVWTFTRVHRIATTIIGLEKDLASVTGAQFSAALQLLAYSDEVKFEWGAKELKEEESDVDDVMKELRDTEAGTTGPLKDRLKHIRQNCTAHEKKLLGGVINPADIHVTFNDVHAPKETIEALKTLTTLSLLRPEAFSYGVLATDRISGLLLYGPPGTGKTLLAKAVAKQSGATVLEVSGASVNDMYVGEGEKNVRAIFTLAKKLSPCIVFIDEADAIFAARGEAKRSSTHRELINQFLREWDGMSGTTALMMVATNRPFDLDEAVLRRLPRRLLVDLPIEKDREAILKLHLKDEILDESVSLAKLAKNTPFYSGSDLKNLSVAAAIACVREENDDAAEHVGDTPYVYPAKRILTDKHFNKAMDEISASISEDMSTLSAIRKFDEKYGDRKGRRKKPTALGFGGTTIPEIDSEAGRVRKIGAS
ncbi:ATPase [Phlyctema vagabunda]|uniref:ATPase n=1 Tax=Phlyctema vagabunda TaxID=108571 RepID=A0ABR4PF05_9HELO